MLWLKLIFAGSWALIADYSIGTLLIAGCLLLAFFSNAIPLIGPFLTKFRIDLCWLAAGIAACMVWGAHMQRDEARRCAAKETVIVNEVTKVVKDVQTPAAQKQRDRYDDPGN